MILNHIANGARFVVELSAPGNAEIFGHCDLHTFDVVPVPDRLNNGIVESEMHEILNRPFTEVVVDTKYRGLRKDFVNRTVQFTCSGAVASKRLLDDNARPVGATAPPQR